MHILKKLYKTDIFAVFAGSDKGCMQNVIDYADYLKIRHKIIFTGFIST